MSLSAENTAGSLLTVLSCQLPSRGQSSCRSSSVCFHSAVVGSAWEIVKQQGKVEHLESSGRTWPSPQTLNTWRACYELEFRPGWPAPRGSDFSSSSLPLAHLPPPPPGSLQISHVLSGLAECRESLVGHEHADLTDGSQHLNSSCYPSTCITDILLSYKHPEVPFSMEQAGV